MSGWVLKPTIFSLLDPAARPKQPQYRRSEQTVQIEVPEECQENRCSATKPKGREDTVEWKRIGGNRYMRQKRHDIIAKSKTLGLLDILTISCNPNWP
eukprot:IDg6690t1